MVDNCFSNTYYGGIVVFRDSSKNIGSSILEATFVICRPPNLVANSLFVSICCINSNFQKNIYPNLFFCNTKSSNEDKFVIQKATLSLIIIDSISRDYFKKFYGASGILISNIYLKIYTIILGSIPSHSDEFHSFYSQFSDNISVKDFDNTISKIKTNQTFDLNLPKFEDFLHKDEI